MEETPILEPKKQSLILEKQECPHHFGYLGERAKKENIPEECMTCEKIVQCMLKNLTE